MFRIYKHVCKCILFSYFCDMSLADNIKTIREEKNLKQIEVATHIGVDKSAYSKIEKGLRSLTVDELQKMASLFDMTTDQIINFDGKIPKEVVLEDKTAVEQMKLIQQLDDEDKQTILRLIDKMLTNKKFKDFFQKNVAAL
jgi:transcriptional regulator with XRE-family HTH domain